ncbi:MAG TPA: BCAM0308 family protein [Nitrospiria bacterium]|nr:BCAM0308 family protein [Nitrospiria bacterium]
MKGMKMGEGRRQQKKRAIPSATDPYLPWGGIHEVVMCRMCHSIYHHKRWYLESEFPLKEARVTPIGLIICPACRKIHDHFPGGVITLRGEFLNTHKDQILNLVRNEEARAKGVNPLERIISTKDQDNWVEIQTTSERLAQRIGREIERAYKGEATYHWSRDDKFVRVEWHRPEGKNGSS